jgi:hypothetical protein
MAESSPGHRSSSPSTGPAARPAEDLGLWRAEADFTDADRRAVTRLRRHVTQAESDECLRWILRVVSHPHLLRTEMALQRRMGRIPRERRLGLILRDRQGFADELVALLADELADPSPPMAGRSAMIIQRSIPGPTIEPIADSALVRRGAQLGMCLVRSGLWLSAYLVVLALLRRWS